MPIRPENRSRYPTNWPDISRSIRFGRAQSRCECEGECGRGTHVCRCPNRHGEPAYGTGKQVVLTVAHLDHTPENCQPANLRAMCQGCHLHYDRDHHARTAARTKLRQATAGMEPLFGPEHTPELAARFTDERGRGVQPLALNVAAATARTARLSPCGSYRYPLSRRWAPGPALHWVLLNPSTADAHVDDPTTRRVMCFSQDAGYAAAVVANLYALRAADPAALRAHPDPIGPDNDKVLAVLAALAPEDLVVVAWGACAPSERIAAVLAGPLAQADLWCVGTTKAGQPRHPLYVPASQPLEPFGSPEVPR